MEQLIKVAREDIIKPDPEDELAADRLKNAAATKKLAIFDAFDILSKIDQEKENLNPNSNNNLTKQGFAEEDPNKLFHIVKDYVPKNVKSKKNTGRTWLYGYNHKYDLVIISKDGTLGDVVNINGLCIGLPALPKQVYKRSETTKNQYWEREELSKQLSKIQSIFQWNEMPVQFKNKWVDYIEKEFDKREQGFWFYNNGKPTYITGSHYMYLQWINIDVGYPDFREANRVFFILGSL